MTPSIAPDPSAPPIYRQLADERLYDPRAPEEALVNPYSDAPAEPVPSSHEVLDPTIGADGGGGADLEQPSGWSVGIVAPVCCPTCGTGVDPTRIRH